MKIVVVLLAVALFGCGIKGDPIAPEMPAELSRGKPQINSQALKEGNSESASQLLLKSTEENKKKKKSETKQKGSE